MFIVIVVAIVLLMVVEVQWFGGSSSSNDTGGRRSSYDATCNGYGCGGTYVWYKSHNFGGRSDSSNGCSSMRTAIDVMVETVRSN